MTCALGPYNFEFMTEVHREITSLYRIDGIFSNRWEGSGMCYCEHCRSNFHAATGLDLPRTADPQAPSRRAYIEWWQQRLFTLWRLWDSEIRKINPAACFIPNAGGGALSDLDMKTLGEEAPILFADRQARSGLMPLWANGKNGKEYRAAMGRKPIGGIFSIGVEEPYRWKDSVQAAPEIRLWALDGIANGLRPWFTKFCGTLHDRRWLPVVEELYTWHYRNERYLRNEEPLARVALVYSQQTAQFYGGEHARAKVEDHALGYYEALVEARIPFEMVHDRLLDTAHVSRRFPRLSATGFASSCVAAEASSRPMRLRCTTSGACAGATSGSATSLAPPTITRSTPACRTHICGSNPLRVPLSATRFSPASKMRSESSTESPAST